jgi:hypothetical protein
MITITITQYQLLLAQLILSCNAGNSAVTRKAFTEDEVHAVFLGFKVSSLINSSC